MTVETRVKIINELPKDISEAALKLHKSLNGNSVSDFISTFESEVGTFCDVMLKKQDKKKDRQILFSHRQSLLEQLGSCSDPALTLHLSVLYLFQHLTGCMLHASGKFVPMIIDHLEQSEETLGAELMKSLQTQQKLVMASLNKSQEEDTLKQVLSDLDTSTAAVKTLVLAVKKSNTSE